MASPISQQRPQISLTEPKGCASGSATIAFVNILLDQK
jgi:hypothetical protein